MKAGICNSLEAGLCFVCFFQVMLTLASESQEHILKQQASVETAYTKLEYLRDLSNIQTQQAKVLTSP